MTAVQVVTPNKPRFITQQVKVPNPGTPRRLPNIAIPDGFLLVIKAKKANGGTIFIANDKSAAVNSTSASNNDVPFTLAANEATKLGIENANLVWIDANVAGDGVELIVEQD